MPDTPLFKRAKTPVLIVPSALYHSSAASVIVPHTRMLVIFSVSAAEPSNSIMATRSAWRRGRPRGIDELEEEPITLPSVRLAHQVAARVAAHIRAEAII